MPDAPVSLRMPSCFTPALCVCQYSSAFCSTLCDAPNRACRKIGEPCGCTDGWTGQFCNVTASGAFPALSHLSAWLLFGLAPAPTPRPRSVLVDAPVLRGYLSVLLSLEWCQSATHRFRSVSPTRLVLLLLAGSMTYKDCGADATCTTGCTTKNIPFGSCVAASNLHSRTLA